MLETRLHKLGDGKIIAERVQDVEPIIENNKRLQKEAQSRKSDLRALYSVPCVILEKWFNEEWDRGRRDLKWYSPEFYEMVHRKMQDPDNAAWRVDNRNPLYHQGFLINGAGNV